LREGRSSIAAFEGEATVARTSIGETVGGPSLGSEARVVGWEL
jgi:hypothetical protein